MRTVRARLARGAGGAEDDNRSEPRERGGAVVVERVLLKIAENRSGPVLDQYFQARMDAVYSFRGRRGLFDGL